MPGESGKKRGRPKGSKGKSGGKKGCSNKKQKVVATDFDGSEYYEAETVVDARKSKKTGDWEYRVQWKGYPGQDTWEPGSNLCDSLYTVALKLRGGREEEKDDKNDIDIFNEEIEDAVEEVEPKQPALNQDEKEVKGDNEVQSKGKKAEVADHWDWNDREQVVFRDIERISVDHPDVARRATEARESGIPIVFVGHPGWANFSRSWLRRKGEKSNTVPTAAETATSDRANQEATLPVVDLTMADNTKENVAQQPPSKMTSAESTSTKNAPPAFETTNSGDAQAVPGSDVTIIGNANSNIVDQTRAVSENPPVESTTNKDGHLVPASDMRTAEEPSRNTAVDRPPAPIELIPAEDTKKGGVHPLALMDGNAAAEINPTAQPPSVEGFIAPEQTPCSDKPQVPTVDAVAERTKDKHAEQPAVADVAMEVDTNNSDGQTPKVSNGTPSSGDFTKQKMAPTSTVDDNAASDKLVVAENSGKPDGQIGRVSDASSHESGIQADTLMENRIDVSSSTQGDGSQEKDKEDDAITQEPVARDASTALESSGWLDLTEDWEVDVNKMIEDIGTEKVPVVRPKYNEQEPIHGSVRLAEFLRRCWPSDDRAKTPQRLYLHQWQFPLSEAGEALCGPKSFNPLPNDILGEDLLALWQDANKDNPYQYIFMGRDETMSKLHRDPGGLAISIAPIVGQKEVVLVHRSDGFSCLSHLQASLEKVDLNQFPLVSQARIYKSVIKPGEILFMPQGTFHQCRNVTPCLSYSRFHLDTVNLRAFLESCINGDAPEISHEEILWNCSLSLCDSLDQYVDKLKALRKKSVQETTAPPGIIKKVDTLRVLRCISRAICLRFERGDKMWRPEAVGNSAGASREALSCEEEAIRWGKLLRDTDSTLHDFRYRNRSTKPQFRPQAERTIFLKTALEKDLASHPKVMNSNACLEQTDALTVGSKVEVNFQGHIVEGMVKKIEVAMQAAHLKFDALPHVYDEFLPYGSLRVPVSGEAYADILPENVKPGFVVVYPVGSEEYRAVVKSCEEGTFILLGLNVGSSSCERWLPRTAILGFKA